MTDQQRTKARNPYVYISGAFAGVWIVMAWLKPESNFFLFPILIAAALPLSYRLSMRWPLTPPAAIGAGVAGLINVVLVSLLLAATGKLEGQTLLPFGGLVFEALVFGISGAATGAFVAMWQGKGGPGPVEPPG